jgi:hypothetical protein
VQVLFTRYVGSFSKKAVWACVNGAAKKEKRQQDCRTPKGCLPE